LENLTPTPIFVSQVDMLKSKTEEEVNYIWREHHSELHSCVAFTMTRDTYFKYRERIISNKFLVLPVR
jgi:hypothetical protein